MNGTGYEPEMVVWVRYERIRRLINFDRDTAWALAKAGYEAEPAVIL